MEYDIVYMNDYIKISCVNCKDEYSMILRSEKKVAEGEGYEFEKIGDETYFLK